MRIIKFLLGSILLTVAAGCGSSIGQSTEPLPMPTHTSIGNQAVTHSDSDRRDILAFYDPLIAEGDLEQRNSINEFSKYDLSVLWTKSTELLGFIGEDYRRITVRIRSVKKEPGSQSYVVRGESVLGDKTSPLQGTFRIDEIRRLKKMHWGVDDELKNTGIKAQGVLTGDYELSGDSGAFKGKLSALWLIDREGRIRFDDIERYADPYRNNQFVGFWTDGKERLRSNWGDFRIPDSGDLDIGAGQFSPDEKYAKNGWETYRVRP